MSVRNQSLKKMVEMALLIAVIGVMAFTPLGFLRIGLVEITFLTVPVTIGAILIGPAAGALLGGVFGLCSFLQSFGMSAFGAMLLSINPLLHFLLCVGTRVLMGWLAGLIYRALTREGPVRFWKVAVAGFAGPALNTILFVSALILFFGKSDYITEMRGGMELFAFLAAFVGTNGLIELGVCGVLSTAVARPLLTLNRR